MMSQLFTVSAVKISNITYFKIIAGFARDNWYQKWDYWIEDSVNQIETPCLVVRDNWPHVSDYQLGQDSGKVPKYKSEVPTTSSEVTKRFNPL
jgi:hypothetical protein